MSTSILDIDFDRPLRLRLVVARYGEMDAARWWNTGDAATPTRGKGRKAKGRGASPRSASVNDDASKADVLAATGLSNGDWNKAIATLLERGDVARTGQKRGTRYCAGEESNA